MGTLYHASYTIAVPEGATVKTGKVYWTVKGEKKSGKLTITPNGENRVLIETDTWVAKYKDENGKTRVVSTKTKSKKSAMRILHDLEDEVVRIRSGVMSRADIDLSKAADVPIEMHLDDFRIRQVATGAEEEHIKNTKRLIETLLDEAGISSLAGITEGNVEKWTAKQRESKVRAPRTINSYLVALKSFCIWATETGKLPSNPMRRIKKLNEAVDRRKERRSLTEDELKRLFETARNRKHRHQLRREEIELVYRLLAGTGLRSTELSLAVPSQFDFERNRFTVKAGKTKNKKADVLPIRPDLAARLKKWIELRETPPHQRIFGYNKHSIYRSFKADCETAGIEMMGDDGRSIDVHSLRRTFGTMLARAGVPLTTTQRLMRHSTPELTAKLYIDVEPIDMMQAIAKLPIFDEQ